MLILMIEDCNEVATNRAENLQRMGYRVWWAQNLRDAKASYRRLLREQEDDEEVVITFDYALPQGETTQDLIDEAWRDRCQGRHHFTLVAASSQPQSRQQQMDAGCDWPISDAHGFVDDIVDYAFGLAG